MIVQTDSKYLWHCLSGIILQKEKSSICSSLYRDKTDGQFSLLCILHLSMDRQTDRSIDRQTDMLIDQQAGRQMSRQTFKVLCRENYLTDALVGLLDSFMDRSADHQMDIPYRQMNRQTAKRLIFSTEKLYFTGRQIGSWYRSMDRQTLGKIDKLVPWIDKETETETDKF